MITFDGCRREPLGSYLQALGLWRAVVRLLDAEARGHWSAGRFVLTTSVPPEQLLDQFIERFEPLPIVSPWNEGAGFKPGGTPARILATVAAQTDPRWTAAKRAIAAAQDVVREGLAAGWGSGKAGDLWDKSSKPKVIQLCRNTLPDEALAWLDATVVLGHDTDGSLDLTFNRLLGTGGNFGRQDLQVTYLQRALAVYVNPRTQELSRDWLRAALHGDEDVPYLRETVGQFDPGRAGGIQSSPSEKADDSGFANPWAFLLAVEGALLFASAATRRQGALNVRASVPFMVRATPAGYGSAAEGENARGEFWAPEWDRPATLGEVAHLLGEGRADWNGGPARSGLDFVRAVAGLGVDRGVRRFTRHLFVERLGQNPLAVPVGVVEVQPRGSVHLLGQLDGWLARLRGVAERSAAVTAALRSLERAMFEHAAGRATLADVVVGMGRLHEAVARSSAVRERVRAWTFSDPDAWCQELLKQPDAELPLAVALASGRDDPSRSLPAAPRDQQPAFSLRELLTPVKRTGRAHDWTGRPALVPTDAPLPTVLALAHRRRCMPGCVPEPDGSADLRPAIAGVPTSFRWARPAPLADVVAFTEGRLDDVRARELLAGLMLLDGNWGVGNDEPDDTSAESGWTGLIPPPLALLLPFYSPQPLRIRLRPDALDRVLLRPGVGWAAQLIAGAVDVVLEDAIARLRAAGIPGIVEPRPATSLDGERLAAAVLVPLTSADRLQALASVAVLPTHREGAMA